MRTLKILFEATEVEKTTLSSSGHRNALSYKKGRDLVTIYYGPRNPSQPRVRIVVKSNENESSSIGIIKDCLLEKDFIVTISKHHTSLNVEFPEEPEEPDSNSSLTEDCKRRVHTAMKNEKMRVDLLEDLNRILVELGYEFQSDSKVKKTDSHKYAYLTILETDWFRISVSYGPLNPNLPYSSVQIDNFKKQNRKYSYWILLFILRILKLYEVTQPEGSNEVTVKPSELELAFDFHDCNPDFLLEITSSIYCKKKQFGWTNRPSLPLNRYEEDNEGLLVTSTHYLGKRNDPNYQIRMYNKLDIPRLEFIIRNRGLRSLDVDSIEDLFSKNWMLDFLDERIVFGRPKTEAFRRVNSSHHYLSSISLKEFISKVPKNKRNNLWRDCFEENNVLRKSLEESSSDFQTWINDLYLNSSQVSQRLVE
jgi:hypothetical protein